MLRLQTCCGSETFGLLLGMQTVISGKGDMSFSGLLNCRRTRSKDVLSLMGACQAALRDRSQVTTVGTWSKSAR